jgi:hypothetical protein
MTSCGGHGGFNGRGRNGHGCGCGGRPSGRGSDGFECLVCRLYREEGHTIVHCYKRFDSSFQGVKESKSAADAFTNSYGVNNLVCSYQHH